MEEECTVSGPCRVRNWDLGTVRKRPTYKLRRNCMLAVSCSLLIPFHPQSVVFSLPVIDKDTHRDLVFTLTWCFLQCLL